MTTVDRLADPAWRRPWLLGKARANAEAADCVRRKVGALIYDPVTFHTLGEGYNGRRPGLPGCLSAGACPRGQLSYDQLATGIGGQSVYHSGPGVCDALHAESNALRRARERGIDVAGAHIVITDEPCPGCWALLDHFDIAFAFWPDGERWLHPNV